MSVELNKATFVDEARRLADRGQVDAALDVVYDHLDEMLLAGDFGGVTAILALIEPGSLSTPLNLAVLTATLPAKQRLPTRAEFFAKVERDLVERGADEPGLLTGLE